MNVLHWSILMLQVVTLAGLGMLWRRTGRFHWQLQQKIARAADTAFAQGEALTWLYRRLELPRPLEATRGWAASPDFLRLLAQSALDNSPACIVECSSGLSTVVLARALQLHGAGHVYSLEHEPHFAQHTRGLLQTQGLQNWATVCDAPLRDLSLPGWTGKWYDDVLPKDLSIDMLVIDGPPYFTAALARYPALPVLHGRLSPGARIFLDDADREPERKTLARWQNAFPDLDKEDVAACEKGAACLRKTDARPAGRSPSDAARHVQRAPRAQ